MIAPGPLLMLAAGGKPRPRSFRVPTPEESKLQIDTADLLRAHCLPDWRWTHIPSGGLRDVITASRMKRFGLQRGWPDILLISPKRLPHFLELKRLGAALSDDQEAMRAWCMKVRIPHCVAWKLDEVLEIFDLWGCLRIRCRTDDNRI
jgi:hypothetical protein